MPEHKRVHYCVRSLFSQEFFMYVLLQGCEQVGRALDMPPDAILSRLLLLMSFFMAHCVITVPGTVWIEPAILWIGVTKPTGSGKTPLFAFLADLLQIVRLKLKLTKVHPAWLLDQASFEKMGNLWLAIILNFLGYMTNYQHSLPRSTYIGEKAFRTRRISLRSYPFTLGNLGHVQLVNNWVFIICTSVILYAFSIFSYMI